MNSLARLAAWVMTGSALLAAPRSAPSQVRIEAGAFDRLDTPVTFRLPPGLALSYVLQAPHLRPLPVQVAADGTAWFLEPNLPRGTQRTYTLVPGPASNQVQAVASPGTLDFTVAGRPAFSYRTTPSPLPPHRPDLDPVYQRGGYLHPVFSPSGRLVTDDYPANHKHHHGLWWAWTRTEFEGRQPDFWNVGDRKGRVEFLALDGAWSGPVQGGFRSRLQQVDLTSGSPRVALLETCEVRLFANGGGATGAFRFDLEILDTCASNAPLRLPRYRYGGLGVRGNGAWDGASQLTFLNSEGVTDRSQGDENKTRGRWAHLGGLVDGQPTGLAILSHPENVHSPQPQRIHPTEPFFNFAPQQAGDLEIQPGKTFRARYRIVVADGLPDTARLDRQWNDYAHPPQVTVLP